MFNIASTTGGLHDWEWMQLYSYQSCDKLNCTTSTARLTIATDWLSQTIALHALQPILARGRQAPPINRDIYHDRDHEHVVFQTSKKVRTQVKLNNFVRGDLYE